MIALILAIALGTGAVLTFASGGSQIPSSVAKTVSYPLFDVDGSPNGYSVKHGSYTATAQVLAFSLTDKAGKTIYISEQPKPVKFDFDDFHKQQIAGPKEILTPIGPAVIGIYGDKAISSIVTDKTWILINASPEVSANDLEQVSKSLSPSKS